MPKNRTQASNGAIPRSRRFLLGLEKRAIEEQDPERQVKLLELLESFTALDHRLPPRANVRREAAGLSEGLAKILEDGAKR